MTKYYMVESTIDNEAWSPLYKKENDIIFYYSKHMKTWLFSLDFGTVSQYILPPREITEEEANNYLMIQELSK